MISISSLFIWANQIIKGNSINDCNWIAQRQVVNCVMFINAATEYPKTTPIGPDDCKKPIHRVSFCFGLNSFIHTGA